MEDWSAATETSNSLESVDASILFMCVYANNVYVNRNARCHSIKSMNGTNPCTDVQQNTKLLMAFNSMVSIFSSANIEFIEFEHDAIYSLIFINISVLLFFCLLHLFRFFK